MIRICTHRQQAGPRLPELPTIHTLTMGAERGAGRTSLPRRQWRGSLPTRRGPHRTGVRRHRRACPARCSMHCATISFEARRAPACSPAQPARLTAGGAAVAVAMALPQPGGAGRSCAAAGRLRKGIVGGVGDSGEEAASGARARAQGGTSRWCSSRPELARACKAG